MFEGKVLVDFYSATCVPCKKLSADLEDLQQELKDQYNLDVIKCNIEDNYDLVEKYDIMSVPTLILFSNNEPLCSSVGYQGKEQLKNFIVEAIRGTA